MNHRYRVVCDHDKENAVPFSSAFYARLYAEQRIKSGKSNHCLIEVQYSGKSTWNHLDEISKEAA